jgi:hypothetical protein
MKIVFTIFLTILVASVFGCGGLKPPDTFRRTLDEPGIWKSINVRESLTKGVVWKTTVDAISQKYDLEVIDKESGYIRTAWKYIVTSGRENQRYRTRVIIKFLSDEVLQIKTEANWLEDEGWVIGFDTQTLEDVYGDMQGRIGRVRR